MIKFDKIVVDQKLLQVKNNFLAGRPHYNIIIENEEASDEEKRNTNRLIMLGNEIDFLNVLANIILKCVSFSNNDQVKIRIETKGDRIGLLFTYSGQQITRENLEERGVVFYDSDVVASGQATPEEELSISRGVFDLFGEFKLYNNSVSGSSFHVVFPNQKLLCFNYFQNFD